ncbi:MAG: calcium-binding protein [Prochloraceae cyanobacterium]|nr:calcium-binding protein [Prochloraceae cyanobacterium]
MRNQQQQQNLSYSPKELANINLLKSFFEAQRNGSILQTADNFFARDGRYIFIRGGEERLGRGDETGPESIVSSTPTAFSQSKGGLPLQGLDFRTSSFPNNLNFFPVKTVPRVGGFTTEANQLDTNAYNDLSLAHERKDLIPFSDNYVGGDGVKAFYQDFFNNFEIIEFITTKEEFAAQKGRPSPYPYGIIANNNNLAVYGEFEFRNKFTGNRAKSFFRIDIEFEDRPNGKIKTYQFWTDTHTLAAAMREGGSWRGQYGLEVPVIQTGQNPEDFRFLTVSELEATGKYENTIFGRQYNPRGYLIQENGTPVNDNPFQQDKVNERLFLPLYVQWGTGNNDRLSGFTDISKYFDPNLPNDQLYGLQGNDTLEGLEGDDELYGGSGDDSLIGGSGNDFLYGHTGLNTLEGGSGQNTFVLDNLFKSNDPVTTSTIVDFSVVDDKIGLAGDGRGNQLKFNDLNITDNGTNGEIRLKNSAASAPPLAIVQNTTAAQLTADKFEELRPDYTIGFTTPDNVIGNAQENKSLVLGFFQSFFTGDIFNYIKENFTQDARYIVIQGENNDYTADDAFSGERYRLSPTTKEWSLNEGARGFIFSLFQAVDVLGTRWPDENNVTNFYIEKIVTDSADPDNVAVFGRFLYRNNSTGILTDGPFAYNIQIKHVNDGTGQIVPKIDVVSFFEDYYAFGYAARQGGTWTRNYNGELTDIIWGTTAAETLDGTARNNIIYGYQSNDLLDGKQGDDEIYGGYGSDTVRGGPGNDRLWGDGVPTGTPGNNNPANNPGQDTFVLAASEGTDTINDFVKGEDLLSLAGNLTFEQLTLTQNGTNTEISITATGEILATLTGVDASTLDTSDFISSATAPQLVFGTLNNDELNIVDASVIVFAGNGNDTVDASVLNSNAKDRIYAGNNDDEVFAGKNDRSFGGAGNDIIDASNGMGGNRLYGGAGNDEIVVKANERAFGGAGNDTIDASGSNGESRLYGNEGNDIFFLGSGDRLVGGAGDDQFYAGSGGGNTITGGQGAEQFWIVNAQLPGAANIITDFELGVDVIGVGGLGLNFNDLALTQQGENTLIATSGQNIAILLNIDSTSLSANNFVFV